MTSRERVLRTIRREPADRTPVDFSANAATLEKLHRSFGTRTHRELLDALGSDIVDLRGITDPIYRGPVPKERALPDGGMENYWGWRTKQMETATGPELCYYDFVLKDCSTLDELAAHPWPKPDWFDFSGFAERLREWEGLAIMATGASVWQHPSFLRSLDQLLVDLAVNQELADFLLDTFTDFYVAYFDRMFTAAPGAIDIFRIADDLGMQDRLLIGPDTFAAYIAPRIARLAEMAHSHGIAVMFHSCGSILPLIEPLIGAGVDILDPIQVTAAGMDPVALKERYGDRLCFHGAIDTQYLLPQGTPQEVEAEVAKMIRILGGGGVGGDGKKGGTGKSSGYILSPSHVLQSDVPIANIRALCLAERSA